MGISIEVVGGENLHHLVDGVVFNEDSSQYGLLCLDILRRKFVRGAGSPRSLIITPEPPRP